MSFDEWKGDGKRFSPANSRPPHLHTHSLAAGADASATDADGQTPLHKAAAGGHSGVCGLLVAAAGAGVGVRDRRGRMPADLAAGDEAVRRVLRGEGAGRG